jgi:AcrR family transcriptional regulator
MARYKRMAREDLAKAILAAARAAVDAGGLSALNARSLAEAAGCSVGMVYNAYPGGLDELVRALNGETLDELHEAFVAAVPEEAGLADPGARLLALADAYIGFAERHTHRWQAIFQHRPAGGSPPPPWFAEKIARLAGFGAELLAPLCRGGDVATARRAAGVLWAGVHGICDLALSDKLGRVIGEAPRELARDLVRRYLAGLAAGAPPPRSLNQAPRNF